MPDIFIAGSAQTKFGELWEEDLRSLATTAAQAALLEAGMEARELDAIFVGNMAAGALSGQGQLGALVASNLGVSAPSYHLEAACASGGMAVNTACLGLLSGKYERVLVVGVEKMTDADAAQVTTTLAGAADAELEAQFGATFPAIYALIARLHMEKYGTTREDMARVSVKNHLHGLLNPLAQFQKEISISDVLEAAPVATPLGLLDCSPISDGAAAVVLTTDKSRAKRTKIVASEIAQSPLPLAERADMTSLDATVNAATRAYQAAGIKATDIGIAEIHDCFSIAEIIAYEDLGFAARGKAVQILADGDTALKGKRPVNTSGGLKACGHPVGATGVKQIVELDLQLRGDAKERQVTNNPKYGLAHNVGGSGATAVVTILEAIN